VTVAAQPNQGNRLLPLRQHLLTSCAYVPCDCVTAMLDVTGVKVRRDEMDDEDEAE